AEAGMEAEAGEIGAETRLRAGDAEVRDHRKPKPAADGGAVDRRDDRLFGAEQPVALDVERLHPGHRLAGAATFLVERRAVAEIGAGAEGLALRRQHH